MFLASSLNDKLKKTMNEVEPEFNQTSLFPYKKPPSNGAVITIHKHDPNTKLTSEELFNLTNEEWEKTFTLPKLRNKWKEKINVNFKQNFKKIPDDVMPENVKEARLYIKDFVDPDNLEIKKNKRWNNSVNPREKLRPELKKTIFEATHKLNDFIVVPLREKKNIEEGVDSRNFMYYKGEKWNNSTLFEDYEKKFLNTVSGENAFENTKRYWRNTNFDRINENIIPISNNRKHFEEPRYYKKYMSPLQETNFKLNTMRKVKEILSLERERVTKKILHDNPGNEKFFEKINSLTNKEMYHTYQEKFNELTGKSKSLTQKNFFKKDWKDEELVDKVKTLSNWKNIKWFKPFKGENDKNDKNFKKRELLKPLVTKGSAIAKEEFNIKAKLEEDYKKEIKKQLLQKRNKTILHIEHMPTKNSLKESKYPLDKKAYDIQIKKSIEDRKTYKRNKSNDNINEEEKEQDLIIQDDNAIVPLSQPYSNKYFLQAYKTVTLDDLKEKNRKRKNEQWIEYQYSHFGTYREFEFSDKIYTDPDVGKFKVKKEKIKAWSCCMNTDEFSKGCRKIRINKLKWNLDNA